MVVMLLEKVPVSVRGDLSRWLIEVKTGLYIGHVSAMVRDKLWEKCSKLKTAGAVFQAWSTNNEQKFAMRLVGSQTREIRDWEGVQLVALLRDEMTPVQKRRVRKV